MRAGKYLQMAQLNADIQEARILLEEAEEDARPRPLVELVPDKDKCREAVQLVIESHLAADYLTFVMYELKDWFDRNGLIAYSVLPELAQIIKLSEAFASSICKVNPGLSDLMVNNDPLIASIHKKVVQYTRSKTNKKNT